jgi:hypothetical protein
MNHCQASAKRQILPSGRRSRGRQSGDYRAAVRREIRSIIIRLAILWLLSLGF